ncbi:MAG: hypothetical protein ABJ360_11345 [Roseobacter sp.]
MSQDEIFDLIWRERIVSDAALCGRAKAAPAAIGVAVGRVGKIYDAFFAGKKDDKELGVRYVLDVKLHFADEAFRQNAPLLHAWPNWGYLQIS